MNENRIRLALSFAMMAYANDAAAVTSLQQMNELAYEGIPVSSAIIAATERNVVENLRASINNNREALTAMLEVRV